MEFGTVTTAVAALAAVLGLVVVVAQVARRFGLAPAATPGGSRSIVVVETLAIAPRRQMTLLRCNGQPLLFVSGGPQDLLLPLSEERR